MRNLSRTPYFGWAAVAVVVIVAYALLTGASSYLQSIAVLIGVYYLLAASLNVVVGYTDLVSFGQAAFFGLGAYAAALTAVYWSAGLVVGGLVGIALSVILALIIATASRQLSGVYFALATLAAAEILRIILLNWRDFTRGPLGLSIPFDNLTLVPGVPLHGGAMLTLVFMVCSAVTVGAVWLVRSDIGKRMISIRENPALAASIGVEPAKYRTIAFCISGAVGAIAGALYAFSYGIVTPEVSGLKYSSIALLMVIFGGRGTLLGPLIGAMVFVLVPQWIDLNGALGEVVFAAILFVVVLLLPKGVVGSISEAIGRRLRRRRTRTPNTEELVS